MNDFIRKIYIKLMIAQFFSIVVSAANSTIDTMRYHDNGAVSRA